LFANEQVHNEYEVHYLPASSFSFRETLQFEKSVMGYYFYNHPTDEYKHKEYINAPTPEKVIFRNNKEVRILALISEIRYRLTKKGDQMANIVIEDGLKRIDATIFSKSLNAVSDKLAVDQVVVVSGKVSQYNEKWQINVDNISTIDEIKEKYARSFEISLNHKYQTLFEPLSALLKQNPGQCPVKFRYQANNAQGSVITRDYFVKPDQQLIDAVDALLGDHVSQINYV
jgi:DNA polymerase-3 subunit alpha